MQFIRWFYKCILFSAIGIVFVYHCLDPTFAIQDQIQRVINVTIYNSYSGFIYRSSGNNFVYSSGGLGWSSGTSALLSISATTGSSYIVSGGSSPLVGSGIGNYTQTRELDLFSGDQLYQFQARFDREYEPFISNILSLTIDRTPPSVPILLYPTNNTLLNGLIGLQWGLSQDAGIGLSGYIVHLSLHPSFVGENLLFTTTTGTLFATGELPLGTIYRYVEAIDYLGNTSHSQYAYFHNGAVTVVNSGGGGGGGGRVLVKDNCPDGDFSWSYYDDVCYGDDDTGSVSQDNTRVTTKKNITKINIKKTGKKQDLYHALLDGYVLAQKTSYRNFSLPKPLSSGSKEIVNSLEDKKIHFSPYVYQELLNSYHGTRSLVPIGYLLIYSSWILLFLIFLQQSIKNYLKKLTKNK